MKKGRRRTRGRVIGVAPAITGQPVAMARVVTLAWALFFGAEGGARGPVLRARATPTPSEPGRNPGPGRG